MSQSNNGKVFFTALKDVLKALWKIFLFLVYGFAKLTEVTASFISKLTEKMLN